MPSASRNRTIAAPTEELWEVISRPPPPAALVAAREQGGGCRRGRVHGGHEDGQGETRTRRLPSRARRGDALTGLGAAARGHTVRPPDERGRHTRQPAGRRSGHERDARAAPVAERVLRRASAASWSAARPRRRSRRRSTAWSGSVAEADPPAMRWWGWGDPAHPRALPAHALQFLRETVGIAAVPRPPVALGQVQHRPIDAH